MLIDETGWQVDTSNEAGYVNAENVPVISEQQQAVDYEKLVHLANCEPTLTDFHIFPLLDESDRSTLLQSGVLRVDFSERPSATDPTNSVQHAIAVDHGNCSGAPWSTLGNFLYSTTAVVPLYTGFPYQNPQPLAAKVIQGGGIYIDMKAGEGFTYTVTFTNGSQSTKVSGSSPGDKTTATVKAPTGFGAGTATVVLNAQTNPARTSTVTVDLGQSTTPKKPKHKKKGKH